MRTYTIIFSLLLIRASCQLDYLESNREPGVTVLITSFNRYDLLERTLDSFFLKNTYPIKETIVVEDGKGNSGIYRLIEKYNNVTWLIMGKSVGQIQAIDMAYRLIKTQYVLHSEDDWETIEQGMIEMNIEYLEKYPNLIQVWNRIHKNCLKFIQDKGFVSSRYEWGPFSFNPTINRMDLYDQLPKGYVGLTQNISYGKGAGDAELMITLKYNHDGWKCIQSHVQFVKHIGQGRHIQFDSDEIKKKRENIPLQD